MPAPTLTLIVDDPPAVTDAGLKLTDVPTGCPLALRLTDCADPLVTAVEIVELPLPPCATRRLTIFGAAAVSTMALAYALETRHRAFIMLFAIACACSSVYGFLIGSVSLRGT